jgi:MFS family permease
MKMGLIELSAGVGYVVGPVFGGFLYHFGGYIAPFAFFSFFQILLAPFIYRSVENSLVSFYAS